MTAAYACLAINYFGLRACKRITYTSETINTSEDVQVILLQLLRLPMKLVQYFLLLISIAIILQFQRKLLHILRIHLAACILSGEMLVVSQVRGCGNEF